MGAITDIWKSERGLVAVALIAAATVLTGMHIIPADQWITYTKAIFIAYAAGKTVTGAVAMATTKEPDERQANLQSAVLQLVEHYLRSHAGPPAPPATEPAPPPSSPIEPDHPAPAAAAPPPSPAA